MSYLAEGNISSEFNSMQHTGGISCSELSSISEQHRQIFRLIYDFHVRLRRDSDTSDLAEVLEKIITNLKIHFRAEETLLSKSTPGQLSTHRDDHDKIMNELQTTQRSLSGWQRNTSRSEFEQALVELLIHHLRDDTEFVRHNDSGW